jgi:hypothetical protein
MFQNFIAACIELAQVERLFYGAPITEVAILRPSQGEWTARRILAALAGEEMPTDNF